MRLRLLALAVLCCTASAAAPAQAATFGLSENQAEMFTSPYFLPLGVTHTRLVVSYDVMTNSANDNRDELTNVENYFALANAAGIKVLVSFQHSRGDSSKCKRGSALPQCKLPSVAEYRASLAAFLAAFTPEALSPWNEINHTTQPTYYNARRAAQYTRAARSMFPGTIVEGDFLDYKFSAKYAKRFKKALKKKRPSLCGLHNYVDVNRNKTSGTRKMMKALKCKRYWWTETGGQFKSRGLPPDEDRQAAATRRMFKMAGSKRFRKSLQRVYNYSFFGNPNDPFDAGLIDATTQQARKAYGVFASGF